ncbi:uncharacterized membrane protein At1g16860 isoform X3 [Populus alba]|uniref:uncharacterized membrane protein At1g16860 isoform X3 n=1 Tax=Populus alba TaxID=43335 RepID=UPI003CC703E4
MNDLSNTTLREHNSHSCKPIPRLALGISLIGDVKLLSFGVFVLFLILTLLLLLKDSLLRLLGETENVDPRLRATFISIYLNLVSCGSVSLESSYERAARCTYVSTLLYEYGGFGVKPMNANSSCLQWNLKYCERFSTDFYITDRKSGIRAMVKAGSGCKVVPLIVESKLVTTRQCRTLSSHLRKWLQERNLSAEARLLRLEEGYVQEGSFVTVIGVLRRNNDISMIVQPQELFSTGCLWQKLLLPVDVDGLILGFPDTAGPNMNPGYTQHLEQ